MASINYCPSIDFDKLASLGFDVSLERGALSFFFGYDPHPLVVSSDVGFVSGYLKNLLGRCTTNHGSTN